MRKFGNGSKTLECSSKGDSRFSAMVATLKCRKGRTIEDIYQSAKTFEGGIKLSPKEAKGKQAINMPEVRKLYTKLWKEYFHENPELIDVIRQYDSFSDTFGKDGCACQAEEIYNIKQDMEVKMDVITAIVQAIKDARDYDKVEVLTTEKIKTKRWKMVKGKKRMEYIIGGPSLLFNLGIDYCKVEAKSANVVLPAKYRRWNKKTGIDRKHNAQIIDIFGTVENAMNYASKLTANGLGIIKATPIEIETMGDGQGFIGKTTLRELGLDDDLCVQVFAIKSNGFAKGLLVPVEGRGFYFGTGMVKNGTVDGEWTINMFSQHRPNSVVFGSQPMSFIKHSHSFIEEMEETIANWTPRLTGTLAGDLVNINEVLERHPYVIHREMVMALQSAWNTYIRGTRGVGAPITFSTDGKIHLPNRELLDKMMARLGTKLTDEDTLVVVRNPIYQAGGILQHDLSKIEFDLDYWGIAIPHYIVLECLGGDEDGDAAVLKFTHGKYEIIDAMKDNLILVTEYPSTPRHINDDEKEIAAAISAKASNRIGQFTNIMQYYIQHRTCEANTEKAAVDLVRQLACITQVEVDNFKKNIQMPKSAKALYDTIIDSKMTKYSLDHVYRVLYREVIANVESNYRSPDVVTLVKVVNQIATRAIDINVATRALVKQFLPDSNEENFVNKTTFSNDPAKWSTPLKQILGAIRRLPKLFAKIEDPRHPRCFARLFEKYGYEDLTIQEEMTWKKIQSKIKDRDRYSSAEIKAIVTAFAEKLGQKKVAKLWYEEHLHASDSSTCRISVLMATAVFKNRIHVEHNPKSVVFNIDGGLEKGIHTVKNLKVYKNSKIFTNGIEKINVLACVPISKRSYEVRAVSID